MAATSPHGVAWGQRHLPLGEIHNYRDDIFMRQLLHDIVISSCHDGQRIDVAKNDNLVVCLAYHAVKRFAMAEGKELRTRVEDKRKTMVPYSLIKVIPFFLCGAVSHYIVVEGT
jgi:hypothetical protein